MIDVALIFLHLVAVTAFVPAFDDEYTEWDIVISEDHTEFIAKQDDRFFYVIGDNMYEQFTKQLLRLWDFELYGS